MLYNPKWGKAVTLPAITKWLETKPPAETYNVFVLEECLLGQYLQFTGVPYEDVGEKSSVLTGQHKDMRQLVFGPNTFGDALQRARKIESRQGE